MKRLTIRDVAQRAGVSVGTVSNALNRPDLVADQTLARIRRAIDELSFVPNGAARQLRAGASSAIGLVLWHASPFFDEVTRGVEAAASVRDQLVVLCNSEGDVRRESRQLRLLEEQRVAGILLTPAGRTASELPRDIRRRGTPIVLVDRRGSRQDQCSVSVDDVLGGRLAAEHLIALGHNRMALINGPRTLKPCEDRRKGFVAGLAQAGLQLESADEIETDAPTISAGEIAAQRLLARRTWPPAVFCTNDVLAVGAEHAFLAAGLRLPDDVAVIGYDDVPFAAMTLVPLTSIRQPGYELGYRAAELLLEEATNDGHQHERVVFTPDLVVRESTVGTAPSARESALSSIPRPRASSAATATSLRPRD